MDLYFCYELGSFILGPFTIYFNPNNKALNFLDVNDSRLVDSYCSMRIQCGWDGLRRLCMSGEFDRKNIKSGKFYLAGYSYESSGWDLPRKPIRDMNLFLKSTKNISFFNIFGKMDGDENMNSLIRFFSNEQYTKYPYPLPPINWDSIVANSFYPLPIVQLRYFTRNFNSPNDLFDRSRITE